MSSSNLGGTVTHWAESADQALGMDVPKASNMVRSKEISCTHAPRFIWKTHYPSLKEIADFAFMNVNQHRNHNQVSVRTCEVLFELGLPAPVTIGSQAFRYFTGTVLRYYARTRSLQYPHSADCSVDVLLACTLLCFQRRVIPR